MKKIMLGKKEGQEALNKLSKTLDDLEVDFKKTIKNDQSKRKGKTTKIKKEK